MSDSPGDPSRPLWRTFLAFMAPMLLSNLLQSLSGTISGIYIGQMLGVGAMAAVATFFPILFFFIAFVIGLGAGASVLIGQAWGAREPDRVRAVTGTALVAGFAFGVLVALGGGLFTEPLLQALGTPADIMADAVLYARIMMLAAPGLFLFLLMTSMLRGVGDTVSPLLALMISTAVSLTVTPTLIRGWFGLPQLGVASAAWATVASSLAALAWLALRLRRRPWAGKPHPMAPDALLLARLRLDPEILRAVFRIGVPTGLQMITLSLAEVVLLGLVNGYGSQAVAAYGAVNQIVNYVQFPAITIAITCSILGAQAIGAGRAHRLGHIVRTGLQVNLVSTGAFVLLGYLFSRPVIGLFIADSATVDIAQGLLHVMLWSFIVMGMAGALTGVMRASGTVLVPTAIAIGCIALIEVPVAWLLSRSIGLSGIWYSYPAAFIGMLVLQTAYYRGVWKKKPIKRLI